MQIKIFSGEKVIHITDKLTDKLKYLSTKKDLIFFDESDIINAVALIENLKDEKMTAALIVRKDMAAVRKDFFNEFKIIQAAGGVVLNEEKDILFIYRRGKWDLPKGKMETAETPEICAQREIEEETGVNNLTLHKKIGETYHIYTEEDKDILKISHWFYFTCCAPQKLAAQAIEDITEVKWVKSININMPMENTYQNIKDIVHAFIDEP